MATGKARDAWRGLRVDVLQVTGVYHTYMVSVVEVNNNNDVCSSRGLILSSLGMCAIAPGRSRDRQFD